MPNSTVAFEIYADSETYGDILRTVANSDALAPHLLALGIDFRTPSSASTPRISITFVDSPDARQAIADLFFDDDFDALLTDRDADLFAAAD